MDKIIYPLRDLSLGLVTMGEESERPWNSCDTLTNYLWKYRRWTRKKGYAKYNATFMATTEEVRGGLTFNDGTINCILAFCNGSGYKTTGDGSMGSALTEPDGTAVTWANADLDVYGTQIRNRLYLYDGDATDEPLVFDGTNLINMSRHTTGTADNGGVTTLVDDALTGGDDDWNGQYIEITDAGDGTIYRGYVTDFVATTDTITFSPARDAAVVSGDTYKLGVDGQEERNGKFTILHKNRIFTAVGSLLYYTVPYYPDWWGPEDGYATLKKPGWKDGEDITALAVMDDYLIVFKSHNIYAIRCVGKHYMWQETKIVGTDSNKGCVWHRTLKRGFGGLIYHSWDGVYVLDRSLNVHCVSRNIDPTIKALTQSVSNPGGLSSITKIDYAQAHFDAGTKTNIDTATVSGTFRVSRQSNIISNPSFEDGSGTDPYNFDNWTEYTSASGNWYASLTRDSNVKKSGSYSVYFRCYANNGEYGIAKCYVRSDAFAYVGDDISVWYRVKSDSGTTFTSSNTLTGAKVKVLDSSDDVITTFVVPAGERDDTWHQKVFDKNLFTDYIDTNLKIECYAYGGKNMLGDNFNTFVYYDLAEYTPYETSGNLISRIHDMGTTLTAWRPFVATETLNGGTIAWQVRSDNDSNMSSPTAWTDVENGGIPAITLQQYAQWKGSLTTVVAATPVVDDVTIQAYTGSAVNAPCAYVYDKAYWLSVQDTGSEVNSCVYVLDEEALMYEQHERWSKLEGLYINEFLIFNDQLMGTSVGGTGKGGFLYYLDTGTKDLGSNFTATLITQKLDFSNLDPTYRDREKVYKKLLSKYKSQQDASLYYKIDAGSWSSAITLSARANVDIEEDWFVGLQRGKYLTLKVTQAVADYSWEWHGIDILARIARLKG